ncbi:MAG: alpha-amylase family glycosyl hydrolase, partial [Candidatus Kapaibacterium sp.]
MTISLRLPCLAIFIAACSILAIHAQPRITRVDPPHWWPGLGSDTLELLVEGSGLSVATLDVRGTGVSLLSDEPSGNPRYRYVRLRISPDAPAQRLAISVRSTKEGATTTSFAYELRSRDRSKHQRIGLDAGDLAYLIMADRFANGDTTNDTLADMQENTVNRAKPYGRHGGDIAGIRKHLDFISSLGVTALWMCPLLRNDQPEASYHGYAITDHYVIDPRYGTNDEYCALVREAHARSMRVVMDVVDNHTGSMHRLAVSPPDSSW